MKNIFPPNFAFPIMSYRANKPKQTINKKIKKLPIKINLDFKKSGKYIVANIASCIAFKKGKLNGYKDKFITQ